MPRWLLLLATLGMPLLAVAEDDGDLLDDEEEAPSKGKTTPSTPAGPETIDPDADPDSEDLGPEGDDEDLLGGDAPTASGEGVDSDKLYRAQLDEVKGEAPEDELQAWEAYLEAYPRSLYKERIVKRMEELEALLYESDRPVDPEAKDEEVRLSVPLQLENINPRTRLSGGFEWGLPDYINLMADYERAIRRDLSVHGNLRHRYAGWRLGGGVKWAFVKSTRTQTVVSALADIELNTNPAYPAFRPMIGFGKRFGDGVFDLQAQAGAEFVTQRGAGVRFLGGVNGTYLASERVGIFLESSMYMQHLSDPKGPMFFRFNTTGFGLKFMPAGEGIKPGQLEVNLGTTVPYTANYWQFHFGSIMGQVNYFFD